MSELLIMAFDDDQAGLEMRDALENLRRQGMLDTGDLVAVTRDDEGQIALHQQSNTTLAGTVGGAVWGAILGAFVMMPVAGAAVGAGVGALAGRDRDIGINDDFMRAAAEALPPGGSALFVLLRRISAEDALRMLRNLGVTARSLHTALPSLLEAQIAREMARGGTVAIGGAELTRGMVGGLGRVVGTTAF